MKVILALILASISYLYLSPSWNISFTAIVICFVILSFFTFILGFPTLLFIRSKIVGEKLWEFSLLTFVCIQVSFLVPLATFRAFQISIAKNKNLSQWGDNALFMSGMLTEYGSKWMISDFSAMFVSGLLAISLIVTIKCFQNKK